MLCVPLLGNFNNHHVDVSEAGETVTTTMMMMWMMKRDKVGCSVPP